jgi:hypothetical protein
MSEQSLGDRTQQQYDPPVKPTIASIKQCDVERGFLRSFITTLVLVLPIQGSEILLKVLIFMVSVLTYLTRESDQEPLTRSGEVFHRKGLRSVLNTRLTDGSTC